MRECERADATQQRPWIVVTRLTRLLLYRLCRANCRAGCCTAIPQEVSKSVGICLARIADIASESDGNTPALQRHISCSQLRSLQSLKQPQEVLQVEAWSDPMSVFSAPR